MQLLAFGDGEFQLRAAARVEIDLERHQRHALTLDGAGKVGKLPHVHEQFAPPPRLMVEPVGLQILRQMRVDQPEFAALDGGVALGDVRLAAAQRLDLGAGQHDAGFQRLKDFVVEPGLAVFGGGRPGRRAMARFGRIALCPGRRCLARAAALRFCCGHHQMRSRLRMAPSMAASEPGVSVIIGERR